MTRLRAELEELEVARVTEWTEWTNDADLGAALIDLGAHVSVPQHSLWPRVQPGSTSATRGGAVGRFGRWPRR